jgi:hypothetical protein
MTIEFSLRRRAMLARCRGVFWLGLAVVILTFTYFSLPTVSGRVLSSISSIEGLSDSGPNAATDSKSTEKSFANLHLFSLMTLVLGIFAVSFGCYLLGKVAFMELESAGRLCGAADVLCLVGSDFGQLEKAATLLVPKGQFRSAQNQISSEDLKTLTELVKKFR